MPNVYVNPGENLQEAANSLKAGDSLILKPGIHYGCVYIETRDITIVGEEGAILENTMPLGGDWILAEDSDSYCSLAGYGVYKIHCPQNAWEVVTAQGVNHHRLDYHYCHSIEPHAYYMTAWQAMLFESDARPSYDWNASWWNGIEALFVWDQSNQHLYLKYRDGRRPADDLRYSTGPASHQSYPEINNSDIYLWNASGIHIVGLEIRGTFNGVTIARSRDVKVEGCRFTAFDLATVIVDECENVRIHDSYFNYNSLGTNALKPVSKMSSEDPYPDNRLSVGHMYMMHKFWMTRSDSGQGCAMGVRNGWDESTSQIRWPKQIRFDNNETECCTYAVDLMGGDGIEIDRNFCHNHIDIGFQRSDAARNISIHDNRLHEAGYLLMRWHRQDQEAGENFIYNNCCSDIDKVSEFVMFSGYVQPPPPSPVRIAFYHNSFSGARGLFQNQGHSEMRDFLFINNLFSNSPDFWMTGTGFGPYDCGGWDANAHCGGQQIWGSYVGNKNIYNIPRLWPGDQIEAEFIVPDGFVTKGAGIDVTQPFEIAGRTWGPLPGFEPGYSHDIGWIDRGELPNGGEAVATFVVEPATVGLGEDVEVSWTGGVSNKDWYALYIIPEGNSYDYYGWAYTSSCGTEADSITKASGSCIFTMPTQPGTYQFHFYANDGDEVLAMSNLVTVSDNPEPEPEPDMIEVMIKAWVKRDDVVLIPQKKKGKK